MLFRSQDISKGKVSPVFKLTDGAGQGDYARGDGAGVGCRAGVRHTYYVAVRFTLHQQISEDEGIQYIQGIDWLKRNQRSAEENQLLISKNHFLPYSLILNATEMKRLKRIDLQIKTPFPVPMILREQLEQAPDRKSVV